MGARGKREAFSKRLWKTPLHVCTCSQPFPKRLSRPEFPAFSTIAAASIGHALQHKSDPPKQQENHIYYAFKIVMHDRRSMQYLGGAMSDMSEDAFKQIMLTGGKDQEGTPRLWQKHPGEP